MLIYLCRNYTAMTLCRHKLEDGTYVYFETKEAHNAYLKENTAQPTADEISKQQISAYVDRLDAFCAAFIKGMKVENIGLGIGQADTKVVRHITDTTAAALNAVALGSLRVAIDQISIIPADQLDGHFLTEARLTAKRNEIEGFLGLPKSAAYNE